MSSGADGRQAMSTGEVTASVTTWNAIAPEGAALGAGLVVAPADAAAVGEGAGLSGLHAATTMRAASSVAQRRWRYIGDRVPCRSKEA